ncbi:MAG: triose-phosphate isomerase [Thermoproteota archaeon]|nr:triose-phosphate isomerase [Thermoproteota archaeon]
MKSYKKNGPFIINLKNYLETAGDNTITIVKEAEKVSEKLDVEIIISPPQPSLALIAKQTKLKVISQHVDLKKPGSTTGFYIPEIIERIGARGSLINHSEHEIKIEAIKQSIERLRELDLISIVCVKTIEELKEIIEFEPEFIAIEPPELIGTQKSISTEKPSLIRECYKVLYKENQNSKLICGAGINKNEDIKIALENGASGILVSSSITKATNWYDKIFELASAF